MRVQIIRDIISVHGTYRPGQVVDLPDKVAKVWLQKRVVEVVASKEKPEVIPEGMFWCSHCQVLHRADSKTGQRHQKYSA